MQAVGRLGSYISKSVYTVSGPFHPFGGAVDIIVVLQPDGSFKSSPWYVRFGKFQGVLKSKEKLVRINVNGVEADFYMNLDSKGEAYFERVVDIEGEDSAWSGPSTSGEDTDVQRGGRLKSKSCNDAGVSLSGNGNVNGSGVPRTNSRRSQIFGLVFGNRSKGNGDAQEGCDSSVAGRTDSMERAEMAADLLDLNWSTPKGKRDAGSRSFAEGGSKGIGEKLSVDEKSIVPNSSCQEVEGTVGENKAGYIVETDNSVKLVLGDDTTLKLSQAKEGVFSEEEFLKLANGSGTELRMNEVNLEPEKDMLFAQENSNVRENLENGDRDTFVQVEKTRITLCSTSESIVTESFMETVHIPQSDISVDELESNGETLLFGELDDVDCRETGHADGVSSQSKCCSEFPVDQSFVNAYEDTNSEIRGLRSVCSVANISTGGDVQSPKELTRAARSLPSMSPMSNGLDASLKSQDDFESNDHHSPCVQSTPEDIKTTTECDDGTHKPATPPRPSEGSRRSWPFSFSRSRSIKSSPPGQAVTAGNENSKEATSTGNSTNDLDEDKSTTKANMNTTYDLDEDKSTTKANMNMTNDLDEDKSTTKANINTRKIIRAAAPSSEQLASLNLKEGKNIVIFTFSTAMLGQQQVDACIFLWRWDSRIVISDVDGTITRSDLLGQVMPLVGMDWSQTGVAHFFSAIKENGYQFIFLSARSISQAFITRQFLFKIKQDGKALPDGPVVISPDGLFPSLFREVVRRAPHEFKIACLEDIKALFPADTNPFYAGFGNRDTDEFSYLKVGIPRSKIFIINPKGEVVVNRRTDTKSYVSLHGLVHGMFPTMISSSEQEDFNTWNYWKLPPPNIDD